MGVYVDVPVRTTRLRDAMLALLAAEYRPWSALCEGVSNDFAAPPTGEGNFRIRFSYRMGLIFGQAAYVYAVARWVALKVGRKRRFPRSLPALGGVSYLRYDDYLSMPIVPCGTGRVPKDMRHHLVDALGRAVYAEELGYPPDKLRRDRRIIGRELRRLDRLWQTQTVL